MTLDDYVQKVDYGDSYKNYHPSTEALQYVNLVNLIYGEQLENQTPIMHYQMFDAMFGKKDICIVAHRGSGKALALDEVVYKADGTKVTIEDVKLGERILAPDGTTTKVIWKSKVFRNNTYRVTFEDGRSVVACKHHFWKVNRLKRYTENYIFTTEELFSSYKSKNTYRQGSNKFVYRVKNNAPIEFENTHIPDVEAKYLGKILGEGILDNRGIEQVFLAKDLEGVNVSTPRKKLFIPERYKHTSIEYRTELLNALIDSRYAGSSLNTAVRSISMYLVSRQLATDICEVARTLGLYSTTCFSFNKATVTIGVDRKYALITEVKPVDIVPTQCISVDHIDKQFLTTNYVATVNSTSMAQNLFFYLAIYEELPRIGKVDFAIYVSDTVDNGCKTMTNNMEYTWNTSQILQKLIPKAKFTMGRWTMTNLNGHELIVRTYGALTGIRGGREKNRRPKLAVIDDVLSDTTAVSEAKLESIKDTIFKAIEEAMHPNALQILIGTPFHSKCVVSEAVASGNYTNVVFPICEKFPCRREEFRGSWEDRFPYDIIAKKYNKAKNGRDKTTLQGFYQELMLTPTSKERRMVEAHMFGMDTQNRFLDAPYGMWNFYITTDFATSDKESSDYSFILVWAYGDDSKKYIVDGYCGKNLMDKNIDELFRLVQKWKPQRVGVEINGQQGGFIPWLNREMKLRGIHFKFASSNIHDSHENEISSVDGIRSSGNKMTRFSVLYPDVAKGNFIFMRESTTSEWYIEAMKELLSIVPEGITSAHDDFIDAFSQIQYMPLSRTYFSITKEDISEVADSRRIFGKRMGIVPKGYNSYTVQE